LLAHWLVVLVLVVVILSGCQRDKPPAPEQPFKIGVVFPFSGNDCATGLDLQSGVELALEIVNQEYDLDLPLAPGKGLTRHGGIRLQAIYHDSSYDPVKAAKSAEELVINEKVKVLIGGYTCAESMAISERTEILRVPLLNCTSTSPRLTQRGLQWFFRITPDDTFYAHNFFQFLQNCQMDHPGSVPPHLVLIYEKGAWGTGVARLGKRLAKKYGYEIIGEIPYNSRGPSFEKILATSSHMFQSETLILQASPEHDALLLMEAYKSQGIRPAAILAMNIGSINPGFIKTLGSQAEYVLSQGVWSMDVSNQNSLATQVNDLFKQLYGRELTANSARSFTGTIVLADALNRASALTPKAIRDALLQTDISAEQLILPWQGIKFDPNTGQNLFGGGYILQIQHGECRTVWPRDIATSRVIWPISPHQALEAQP
jgi:branched-chain amino acid transport system substrate-binding protein